MQQLNARSSARRAALRKLNGVVSGLDMDSLCVNAKAPDPQVLLKLWRFLARRELEQPLAEQCRQAVEAFIANGGQLPEGFTVCAERNGVAMPEEGSPVVPRHKVLRSSFRLHSRAFMVTYNSLAFTLATWGPFLEWVKAFAVKNGARAWAACLEESTKATTGDGVANGQQRYHVHAYFIWLDDTGLHLRSLDTLYFENVHPRVDVCKGAGSAANFGGPRRAALHGLWYVTVKKAGSVYCDTNFHPWQEYSPSMAWLGSLWDDKKLTHEAFLELSAQFRTGLYLSQFTCILRGGPIAFNQGPIDVTNLIIEDIPSS